MKPKIFVWLGSTKGGFERRTLKFCEHLMEKGIVPDVGVYQEIPNLKFPQIIMQPIFRTEKLRGYDNLAITLRLSYEHKFNEYDILLGWFVRHDLKCY